LRAYADRLRLSFPQPHSTVLAPRWRETLNVVPVSPIERTQTYFDFTDPEQRLGIDPVQLTALTD
jgi:hypothetical protein